MRAFTLQAMLVFALLLAARPARAQKVIKLTVGQSQTISVPGTITKVQVLNPTVADVATYSVAGATVVGISAGTTEVLITANGRKHKFTVTVTGQEVSTLYKQVRTFLGRIEGIYPRLFGETVILSGFALTAEDYGRAQEAVRIFGNKVQNQVRFRPSAVQQVNQLFKKVGLGSVQVNLVGGALFLEGAVSSESEMEKVKALLRTFGLNVENLLVVGGGRQILIDVQFVELRKSGLHRIGVQLPGTFGVTPQGLFNGTFNLIPQSGNTLQMNITSPFQVDQAVVNLLFNNGTARLLAQPRLVCGSGKAAEFLVGGEVPIVQTTQMAIHVDWKAYGIMLRIKPVADSLGNIQSEIYAEVSEVDNSVAVQNIPGFRTRKFKTDVSVKDGSSIVLSGLFSNTEQKSVSKFPLLGQIPILGELFKSREFRDQKTTLVVFVTPKVVTTEHPWVQKSIGDIQKMYKDYESEVGWQIFD
jgi:pilus assembly protein CpaC